MKVSPPKTKPIVTHDLEIGRFTYYKNVVVAEYKEDANATFENSVYAIQVALEIYGNDVPVVYISHRKYSYSVNPLNYKEIIDMFPNFVGFAVVSENKRRRMMARLEKLFIKKPIRVFSELDEGLLWAENLVLSVKRPAF